MPASRLPPLASGFALLLTACGPAELVRPWTDCGETVAGFADAEAQPVQLTREVTMVANQQYGPPDAWTRIEVTADGGEAQRSQRLTGHPGCLVGDLVAQPATVSMLLKLPTGIYTLELPEATHETKVDDPSAIGVFGSRGWALEEAPEPLRALHDPIRDDRTDYRVITSLSFNFTEAEPETLSGVFSIGFSWTDLDDYGRYSAWPISTDLVPVDEDRL